MLRDDHEGSPLQLASNKVSGVRATRPAQTNFVDCKVALPIVLRDDHEGSPLQLASDGVSGVERPPPGLPQIRQRNFEFAFIYFKSDLGEVPKAEGVSCIRRGFRN